MRKVKFKSVNELYGVKSEVTSMVKGSFCSEKLADDSDFPAPLNMGSFKAEKGFCHAQFSRGKLCLKEESVKCSSCAPSCSPYVHSEEIAIKTNAFAGEACRKKQSNLCSFNDTDLSSHRVNSPSNGHHKSSMGSHPLSACLSHESSENAESGETCCDCNTSEGIKRIIKPNMNQTCAKNCTSLKEPVFHDNVVSNQLEKQASECLGDNISFICGSEHVETRAGYCNSDANKKNASYSSASINSFSETESASCYIVGGPCRKKSNRLCNESSQEILCCSNKSDFSEISSLRDSRAGASSAKGEHSECSVEQAQLSFARADAVQVGSQIGGEHNSVDSMQVDTGINEREQTDEVKLTTVVKKVIMEETTIGSWSAACSDGPDSIEYDVKVCDICGDIGREELLAVCSKCNDGAEHTYCMRVKMDSVPKGDWMCEECVISSKDNENRKEEQLEGVRILKRSSEAKALEVEKSKVRKACSIPLFSSKRPADSLQLKRKRPLGTFFESPSPCSSSRKTSMHQSGGHSCSTTMKTVCIPTESSGRLRKLSSQSQASRGLHFKSKSFSTTTLKEDVKQLKKGTCRNEGLVKETVASESRGRDQMVSKSVSLKNMKSYNMNNSNHDIKLCRSISHVEDLKVSRHPKGEYSTKTEKKLRLANGDSFASMADKRTASLGENSLPQSSSYSIQDLKAAKGNEISSHSLKRPVHPAQGGSANEEKKSFINDRQHVECPMEVVPATSTKHSKANVHSDEHPLLRDSSSLASKAHIGSLISAVPQPNYIWRGKFEIQSSGGLPFTCDGMQVHLSTYASDKVLELVPKLLQRLSFEEAPRLTMWPTQFMKSRATEDNVALYIFAKDFDSYEGSYKNLMDRMIKNDFSLKGNFGGVELLIFSSNLLPEKSRRWNNLLFLWGVFRGKMVHFSRPIPAVSASENLILLGKSSQNISLSMASPNTQEMLNSNTLLDSKAVTSGRMVEVCETKASSWEQKPPDLQISCSQQVSRVDNQIKNEQFSGADTYQVILLLLLIEEKESKKRPEIDLNCPLQESLVYSAGCTEPDGKRDFKMLKCSPISGMNICNNIIKNINERCAIAKNSQVPSSSGEFECYGVDNTVIASRLDSEGNRWKSLEQQFLSNNGGSQQDPYVSSSLGLKAGRNSSDEGNMPPFLKLVGSKDLQDEYWGREASGDTNPSLALSLALPDPNGSGVLKLDSERKLPPEVNTRLSLF
ncbi:Detected protein of unknown function [Hibiscus syriacus]|uniref:Zinc finger PHD-type domain-containing protein n=1 Tax=Hibiscus syriacus TaxID=106335 RepID=A0A6A2XPV9_HIBSY|nr:Detected protein of unknown function [Hibiscus syriacus]